MAPKPTQARAHAEFRLRAQIPADPDAAVGDGRRLAAGRGLGGTMVVLGEAFSPRPLR
jgi:hypothetical protein